MWKAFDKFRKQKRRENFPVCGQVAEPPQNQLFLGAQLIEYCKYRTVQFNTNRERQQGLLFTTEISLKLLQECYWLNGFIR